MHDDAQLLRRYAEGSEVAFAAFVQRHLPFVYNTALRRTGADPHRAAEIAQLVFTDAARRAPALARHRAIAGWLFVATRNTAINLARADSRRRAREQAALEMTVPADTPLKWAALQPVIDAALDELNSTDRDAVLARFFHDQTFAEIGSMLRLSENAARMRVDRALGKLQRILLRHGIRSTTTALSLALSEQIMASVPPGLAASISVTAASAPTLGAIAFLTMGKIQAAAAALLIAAMLAPPLLELRANRVDRAELENLRAGESQTKSENARLLRQLAQLSDSAAPAEANDLARSRARAAVLRARPDGVLESEMTPPANKGWKTPADAFETLLWALQEGDWDTLSRGLSFDVGTQSESDAFFGKLPREMRDRYGTSERFLAHAWCTGATAGKSEWIDRLQVFETKRVDGPAPMQIRAWGRARSGRETLTEAQFERHGDDWTLSTKTSARVVRNLMAHMDPNTGRLVAHKPGT